jgi:hypothetical protein
MRLDSYENVMISTALVRGVCSSMYSLGTEPCFRWWMNDRLYVRREILGYL